MQHGYTRGKIDRNRSSQGGTCDQCVHQRIVSQHGPMLEVNLLEKPHHCARTLSISCVQHVLYDSTIRVRA
uniref:Uncharacterized protein n=1 Tax=Anopheles minimus TaxID=112268 RepID=A0A182WPX6_9DIPT